MRSLYVLGFTPPEAARDGASRKLEVQVSPPGYTVRARGWYSLGVQVE